MIVSKERGGGEGRISSFYYGKQLVSQCNVND